MHSIIALGFLAFAGLSAAQDQPQQNYPYTIDPESVRGSDRQAWCDNQKAQCPLICLQQPDVTTMTTVTNDCDPDTLVYSCVCENNVAPNITQYTQTIPYYICTEWGNQCVADCGSSNTCANSCRADHPCGAQSPNPPNSTMSATAASTAKPTGSDSEATGSVIATGFGGAAATTAAGGGEGAASAMLNLGQSYGMAVIFAGVFAGFAIIL